MFGWIGPWSSPRLRRRRDISASQQCMPFGRGQSGEAESLLSAATALIETSDQLYVRGNGLLDFAEVRELAGAARSR